MKVGISIVSFNTKNLLESCLKQLQNQKVRESEVWVVDNCSEDGSADMVEKEFKKVNLIRNDQNVGFAKGHNISLKKMSADLILILNPDTEVPEDSLEKMVEFMERNPKCGISSCKIVGFDGTMHSNGGDEPVGLALMSWLFNLEVLGELPNFHRQEESYYKIAHPVGWVGGTFMMVRSEVFQKIGYLNEDYFMYFEDSEFCYRAKRAGFEVLINPDLTIKHASGASSKDPRLRQWTGEMVGLLKFYKANFGSFKYWLVKTLVYFSTILRIIAFSILGKKEVAKTYGQVLAAI